MSDDLFSLRDRVAVVTGGSGQLGAEIVRGLEERGARVAVFDLADRHAGPRLTRQFGYTCSARSAVSGLRQLWDLG